MDVASRADRFSGFYERWWPHVKLVAHRVLRCDAAADDVAQVIFQRLWAGRDWNEVRNPKAYLERAALIEALRTARRRDRSLPFVGRDVAGNRSRDGDVTTRLIRQQSWRQLERLLLALPESLAAVTSLTILQGLTRREAAERLGLTLEAVEKRLTRAYRALRQDANLTELHEVLSILVDGGG